MQELPPDPAVQPDPPCHVVHVGPDPLAQVGDLVDERDLRRQERVARVLRDLRRLDVREHHRRLDQVQRTVDPRHHLPRPLALHPDHHAVGLHEVLDRRALTQELRVRRHVEFPRRTRLADDPGNLPTRADRHRRLGHHHRVAPDRRRDLRRRRVHVAQVGMPVAPTRRRADRDEHRIGIADRLRQVRPEPETARLHIVRHKLVQPGLVDRHDALQQPIDLPRILVDAENIVPEVSEAGPGHQTDVAGTDHRYTHILSLSACEPEEPACPRWYRHGAGQRRHWLRGSRGDCRNRSAGRRSVAHGTDFRRSSSPWRR